MPVFKIHHITKYEYDALVKESINEVRIIPYQCPEQEVLQHQLYITGSPAVFTFTDYWKNTVGSFNLLVPHKELIIESKLVVRTITDVGKIHDHPVGFEELEKELDSNLSLLEQASANYIQSGDKINAIVAKIYHHSKPISTIVKESSEYIYQHFQYIKGITNV